MNKVEEYRGLTIYEYETLTPNKYLYGIGHIYIHLSILLRI
jgi:hypothetical protein